MCAAPAADTDLALALLASKFPTTDVELVRAILAECGGDLARATRMLAENGAERAPRSASAHRRKAKRKSGAAARDADSARSKRRAKRIAEVRKLQSKREAHLRLGGSEDSFAAELHAASLANLLDVGNEHEIALLAAPRPGKKLLVLDLDYTMFDYRSQADAAGNLRALKRPYLDRFLASAYKSYDLAIWSQSHWRRLELVLTELGLLTHPLFRLCFVIDAKAMYRHATTEHGRVHVREVKDLHLIWGKFAEHYNPCNTLHIDDLETNFALNPGNGILVPPFDRELRLAQTDDTLVRLRRYLKSICEAPDVSLLDHSRWRTFSGDAGHDSSEESVDSGIFSVSSLSSSDRSERCESRPRELSP